MRVHRVGDLCPARGSSDRWSMGGRPGGLLPVGQASGVLPTGQISGVEMAALPYEYTIG
jgi:hypothetical protein